MQNSSVPCSGQRLLQFGLELGGLGVLWSCWTPCAGPIPLHHPALTVAEPGWWRLYINKCINEGPDRLI